MGNVGIKLNGQWIDFMSPFVPCQLCDEAVQIRSLGKIESEPLVGIVTWLCKKCSELND